MKKTLSIILSMVMLLSCFAGLKFSAFAITQADLNGGLILTADTTYNIAPGLREEHVVTVNDSGTVQNQSYVGIIDFSSGYVGAMAGYKDYDSSGTWGMQTVRDQAAAAAAATGRNIVLAINADYYNMSTGEPTNRLVMNGKVVKDGGSGYYFAILNDGTPVIRFNGEPLTDVKEAVGSPFPLLINGEVWGGIIGDQGQMPRNAIGMTADGKVVVMVNDGRQAPKSVGYTLPQLAELLKAYGVVDALYLDGGGSATFASKTEGETALTVKNSPSDGTERLVSDSLFFYSTAAPTGVFDHATLSPNGEIYTPYSSVQFTATGVDVSGSKVDLPEGVQFALADDSFGTITDEGLFTSTGKEGIVTVNLLNGEAVVGTVSVEIAVPDSVSFVNEEIALAFDEQNDLGLTVKNKDRTINYNDGDFVWTVESTTEGVEASALGSFGACAGGSGQTNIFTASSSVSGNGIVTARYFYDDSVSGSINLIIGREPTIVMDFEGGHEDENGFVLSAEDYWTFGRAAVAASGGDIRAYWNRDRELQWIAGSGELNPTERCITAHYFNGENPLDSRGGEESAELVSFADNDELVRKGNYSLKINYDYSNINGIEGACVGFSNPNIVIPGTPTGIGMWVYVPEGTANLWLRIRFKDRFGVVQTMDYNPIGMKNVNFDNYIGHNADELITYADNSGANIVTTTIQQAMGGFNWTGWKYVECDLSGAQGPFTLLGGETVRVMHTFAAYGGMGNFYVQDGKLQKKAPEERKGYIIIDDVQFVYGTNTEDTDNPSVDAISADLVKISDGAVFEGNTHTFSASFSDVQNRYTSGLNYDTVSAWIDGVSVPQSEIIADSSKDEAYIYDQYLTEGVHTIKFVIKDNNDNKATLTKNFVIENGDGKYPAISVAAASDDIYVGKTADVKISTTDRARTSETSATVSLGNLFRNYTVEYAEGYEEAAAPVYNAENNSVTVSAKKTDGSEVSGEGAIADLLVAVPTDVPAGSSFTYAAPLVSYKAADEEGGTKTLTFTKLTESCPVKAKYTVTHDVMVEGLVAELIVLDEKGKPAADVDVYKADGTHLGITGASGTVATRIFKNVEKVSVYAKDEADYYSFITTAQSFVRGANEDGTPTYIQLNASPDSESAKNITWFSRPAVADKKAVAQVALKAEYDEKGEEAFKSYEGETEFLPFGGSSIPTSNYVVYSNTVEVNGLTKGSEYAYRVGDGEKWSEVYTFNTFRNGLDTSFFVVGDTQAEDTTVIDTITDSLAESGFNFGIQTGDFVEKTTLYDNWNAILTAFNDREFKSTDMIHVTGNHELFGDDTAEIQNRIFNVENRLHYSATYGNVYVAVLGYSDNDTELQETAEWLVEDAAKSDAQWKIVASHQPVYGSNENTSDCDVFRAYISKACDDAGIDFVFSGHDHSYARTEPVLGGEVDENGTVYFICGSTGEKSYTPSNTRGFHFAYGPTYDVYTGLYLTVNAGENTFEIQAKDFDGRVIDTCTKTKKSCENNLHTYTYENDGYLTCSACGHCEAAGTYTGIVKDAETGLNRYLVQGVPATDRWFTSGDDNYYLDENGYVVTGEKEIDGITFTFDEEGRCQPIFADVTVTDAEGNEKVITRYFTGGLDKEGNLAYAVRWTQIGDDWYFFKRMSNAVHYDDGAMLKGGRFKIYTPGKNTTRYSTFDENGVLILGGFEDETDNDGNYKGTRYYFGPSYVTGEQVISGHTYTFGDDGFIITKSIKKCTVKAKAVTFTYNGKAKKPAVTVTDKATGEKLKKGTHYTVTYKNNNASGTGTVTVKGNAKRGYTGTYTIKLTIRPRISVKQSGVKTAVIKWTKVTGASKYYVYRLNSKGEYKKIAETKTNSYKDGSRTVGTKYSYKVKAVKTADGKNTAIVTSAAASVTIKMTSPKISSVKVTSKKTAKVTWSKVSNATGYLVYRSTSKTGTFKKTATVKTSTSYVDTTVRKGKTYYYKVLAYAKVSSKTYKSALSDAKSVKIK